MIVTGGSGGELSLESPQRARIDPPLLGREASKRLEPARVVVVLALPHFRLVTRDGLDQALLELRPLEAAGLQEGEGDPEESPSPPQTWPRTFPEKSPT